MNEKLRECPSCGSSLIKCNERKVRYGILYFTMCLNCMIKTSDYPTKGLANRRWNTRNEPKHETVEKLYGGHHPQWWVDTAEDLLKIIDCTTTLANADRFIAETEKAVHLTWKE